MLRLHFKKKIMSNETKQTAVNWYINISETLYKQLKNNWITLEVYIECKAKLKEEAKEMEKEQRGYSKEDVLKAGELGEINHIDTKHIVSYLDEAKQHNETYGGNK